MRKTLFILTLALISSMTMMADYNFKFCGSLSTATGLNYYEGEQMRVSLEIPADMASQLAGNQITEICFAWAAEKKVTANATVFVMEGDQYVSTGSVEDFTLNTNELAPASGTLDTPYTIKENTPFTFGYIMDDPISGLYPLGLSQSGPALFSGQVEILEDGVVVGQVSNVAEATGGYTTFLYAVSVGEKDALLNYVLIEPDGVLLPTVEEGGEVTVTVKVLNLSSKYIPTIKFELEVGGNTSEFEYTRRISAGATKALSFSSPAIPAGRNNLNVKVVQTGDEVPSTDASYSTPVIGLSTGEGYPQKVVVEEGTGTWCGWCPRGIVGMEFMAEQYPDNFIGICVHGGNDPFVVSSYNGLDKFITGYPSSVTNRQPSYIADPSQSNLEKVYNAVANNLSIGQINLEVVQGDNELYALSTTDFAIDHFCSQGYKVAFVIIENGLVGAQTNYYANGQGGSLEWWDKQRSTVKWTYSDTARDIFDFDGLNASLMNNQITTSPYRFQATLPLTNVKDVANTAVIALLLDDETGVIMNACRVYYDDYKTVEETGVSNVALDKEVKTIGYYTISGQKIDHPQRGQLYIETLSNGTAIKRIFK